MRKKLNLLLLLIIPWTFFAHTNNLIERNGHSKLSPKVTLQKEGIKEKCGTIQALIDFQKGIRRPRPTSGPKYIYTTHFIIHFDTIGNDATTRAFAETAAVHAELSWSELTALGWMMPPPDGSNGGDSRYDIYIRRISGYGLCYPESPSIYAITGLYPASHTSYVVINVSMSWGDLRATVIHEFHHGIQFGYSVAEWTGFYENTSTFIEDYFYDYVNYLQSMLRSTNEDPLDQPYQPICLSYINEYTGALWAHFLDEYYDASVDTRPLLRIWVLCGLHDGTYTFEDIDSILRLYYSSDLKKALGHYAIWRAFCGTVNDGRHYIEGTSYGDIQILRSHSSYPASGNEGTSAPIGPGGCNVISFTNFGNNRVTLNFDGQNGYDWACYVIGFCPDGNSYEYRIVLHPTQASGSITIPGVEFNKIFLIPVVTTFSAATPGLTYTYSVTLSSANKNIESEELIGDYVGFFISPNPTKNNLRINYFLPHNTKANLKIYNANGQLIKSSEIKSSDNTYIWNRTDNLGIKVPNGIYFVELKAENKTIKKKILLM
ncbi:MAG: T9SS type A sorting domain-containing protein [candidate division WOR-3 bacterium]